MGRRSNGEGSVFKRKDGRWAAQKYVILANGTNKKIYITGKKNENEKDLRLRLNKILVNEHQNIPYVEKEWKIGEYLDYWMKDVQQNRIRETTMITHTRTINLHIKPVLGGYKLKSLSVQNVRNAMNELEQKGCQPPTIQKCLQILSACITCAMREDLVLRNVAQLTEKPKYTPREMTIWTAEQAALFLQTIKEHPQYIAFLLFLTYGMRRGEVLGLRWCDIHFDKDVIYIRQQIDRINGEIKARDLKTANSRRLLPLTPNVRIALMEHAKKHGIIPEYDYEPKLSIQGTVVVSKVGTPLEPKNLERCFHRLIKRANLPCVTLHSMRHTAATLLKDVDTAVRDAQLILGHSNSSTTLNIYQHGTSASQRTALTAAHERLLKPAF